MMLINEITGAEASDESLVQFPVGMVFNVLQTGSRLENPAFLRSRVRRLFRREVHSASTMRPKRSSKERSAKSLFSY